MIDKARHSAAHRRNVAPANDGIDQRMGGRGCPRLHRIGKPTVAAAERPPGPATRMSILRDFWDFGWSILRGFAISKAMKLRALLLLAAANLIASSALAQL